jgi:hypothetical protein
VRRVGLTGADAGAKINTAQASHLGRIALWVSSCCLFAVPRRGVRWPNRIHMECSFVFALCMTQSASPALSNLDSQTGFANSHSQIPV